jgi:hypothetical protein
LKTSEYILQALMAAQGEPGQEEDD